MIIGLDHLQLAMPAGGEERARTFYCKLLGLSERDKPPHLAARGGCWFHGPGLELHLGVEEPFHAAAKAHPALLVEDLPKARARLAQHGVAFTPGAQLKGYDRGDIEDPFGNRIELMQKL